jgi:hypothetical protein
MSRHSRPAIVAVGFNSVDDSVKFCPRFSVFLYYVVSFSKQEIVEAIVNAYLIRLAAFITFCLRRIVRLKLDDSAILYPVIQIHRAPESNSNYLFSWD